MPSAIGYPSNHDTQMSQSQATSQNSFHMLNQTLQQQNQTLQQQNQLLLQYQQSIQHPLGTYPTPQYTTSAFVDQPATPVPNVSDPPPRHWHRTNAKETPIETTVKQQPAKPKSRTRTMTDQRLAAIQDAHSSILAYKPPTQAEPPTLVPTAQSSLLDNVSPKFGFQPSSSKHVSTPQADLANLVPTAHSPSLDDISPNFGFEFLTSNHVSTSQAKSSTYFFTESSSLDDISPNFGFQSPSSNHVSTPQAVLPTLVPTARSQSPLLDDINRSFGFQSPSSKHVSTPQAESPTLVSTPQSPLLDKISEDFKHVLDSEPGCRWTVHDIPVGLSR